MYRALKPTRYIPENSEEVSFDDVKLKVYTYIDAQDRACAIAYKNKSTKAIWHYNFRSEEKREKRIQETYKSLLSSLKFKEEQKEAKKLRAKEFKESLKVGTILYDTWGYEQTNCTYGEIVAIKGATVTIREIHSELVEETGMDQGNTMPCKGSFVKNKEPIVKRVVSDRIKINDVISLTLWNGKPVWTSWYY